MMRPNIGIACPTYEPTKMCAKEIPIPFFQQPVPTQIVVLHLRQYVLLDVARAPMSFRRDCQSGTVDIAEIEWMPMLSM